jgi:hypothetical protein
MQQRRGAVGRTAGAVTGAVSLNGGSNKEIVLDADL